ncbi:uncharacterized protein LY79DRAFT_320071 [Colletotrichum navitas]|uniref:Uncharacterized protein n=1 Tax=Colletotrichum navitas TaxID=681940 RepID=A0AAD8Q8R4_9PEZI|nr:uncharacterized protein LY79DRAFT_320071 [Colletotrichum navitas]KAK1597865.1 hypothetical protein LY79DRAFT_320071 [Colletotrichum navitas]
MPSGNTADDNSVVANVTASIHMLTIITSDLTTEQRFQIQRRPAGAGCDTGKCAFPFYVEISWIYPCSLFYALFFFSSLPSLPCKSVILPVRLIRYKQFSMPLSTFSSNPNVP